ncbi:MAG: DUF4124 domain-containing protein [Gammaproteobacteria bacterium]|jgi:hypothetical protein|nr:DUF4124 domain-containing protein [Gammaproteobacteria bacterium]
MSLRTIGILLLISTSAVADARIYRCESGGVIEFSDRPCSEGARAFEAEPVSVVVPDEGLPALAEANRRFIEERRRRLAEDRRRRPSAPSPTPIEIHPPPQQTVFIPWVLPDHERIHRVEPGTPPEGFEQRYSPLNGPILGTRRDRSARGAPTFRNLRDARP